MSPRLSLLTQSLFSFAIITFLLQGLFGCGSDSESSDTPSQSKSVTVEARNFSAGSATTTTQVNLSALNVVTVSDNSDFIVTGVEVLSNSDECHSVTTQGVGFTIHSAKNSNLVCDYRYTVNSASRVLTGDSGASGIGRIALNPLSAAEPQDMTPISAVVVKSQSSSIVIDLAAELLAVGEDVSGLTLSETTSYVRSEYSDTRASVNSKDQTLSYTAPASFSGIDRVMFSYNSSDETKLGYLDIAVTDSVNLGLTITPQNKYDEHIAAGDSKVTIDIKPYVVTDHDSGGFFIEQINSFYADVEIVPGTSTFTFESSKVGYHYVSFGVADGKGAFEMGLLRVTVVDPGQIKKWPDLQVGLSLFSAPFTTLEAYLKEPRVVYTGTVVDTTYSPAAMIATFYPPSMAEQYCQGVGRLPDSDELEALANFDAKAKGDWPVSFPYLAVDDDGAGETVYHLVDLTDGTKQAYTADTDYIVSCIKSGMLKVEVIDDQADSDGKDQNQLKFTVVKNDEPYQGITITPVLSSAYGEHSYETPPGSSASMDKVSYTTDANGQFTVTLTSDAMEVTYVTVEITENGVTESVTGTVWFAPLNNSIHLSSLVIDQDDGNGLESTDSQSKITQLTGKIVDDTSTPYQYQPISVTSKELWNVDGKSQMWSGTISDVATADEIVGGLPVIVTDADGQASISVSNYGGLMKQVEVTMTYEPPLGSTKGVTEKTETVSFCNEYSMPVYHVEQPSNGYWFTATPMQWVVRSCEVESSDVYEECATALNGSIYNTGPCGVEFARFTFNEAELWCQKLKEVGHLGRTNWRLPKDSNELDDFRKEVTKEKLLENDWALRHLFWTAEENGSTKRFTVRLYDNVDHNGKVSDVNSVQQISCVSEP